MPLFLYSKNIVATINDGRLYHVIISSLPANNAVVCSAFSFILLYIQALMVNYMVNEYRLIPRQTYLPAMSYLLITSLLPEWNYLSSPLLSSTLIIWMFIKLFRLYNSGNTKAQVYNIGLIAGISSYIYFPSALFVLCILLGIMILKPFKLNEMFLFILGSLTPYYFHLVYLFLSDRLSIANYFPHISLRIPLINSTIWLAASILLLTIPFLVGGYLIQVHMRKMLIQGRKNWSVLLLYLLMAFFVPFINSDQTFNTWVIITAPFAAFHACAYYYPVKRFMPGFLFIITVGYILFQQYGTPTWH
ncbi:MAG: hypothetical protein ACJ748_10345 [Flavisolibacter sp.]